MTVHAPAEEVWAWLVQIGQDRSGFYSSDWLENLAGCDLASADRIHPEWQDRSPGAAYVLFIELPHAIMERKMLLGIKSRAERGWVEGQ